MSNNTNDTQSGYNQEDGPLMDEAPGSLTGEPTQSPDEATPAKAKNDVFKFIVFGAIAVLALAAGGFMYLHRGRPAPARPPVVAPVSAPTSTPAAPPLATAPSNGPTAPAVTPAAKPALSDNEAQALLGGSPTAAPTSPAPAVAPAVAPPGSAASLPSTVAPVTPAVAPPVTSPALAPNPLAPTPGALPAATVPPAAPAPSTTVAALAPVTPVVVNPLAASATPAVPAAPVVAPVTSAPAPAAVPAPAASVASLTPAAPAIVAAVPPAPGSTAANPTDLGNRVGALEVRLSAIEQSQTQILRALSQSSLSRHSTANAAPEAAAHPAPVRAVKKPVTRARHNSIELIQDTPAKATPTAAAKKAVPPCRLAAVVPDRAWIKQDDGSFLPYGIGDTAPNDSKITAIDPQNGITTERGKLACSQTE